MAASIGDLRVCFAGDSYVAGTGDSSALGWVGRVVATVIQAGLPLTAYNLGVRGDTGPQIAARLGAELAPRLTSSESRAVVSFGANDTVLRDGHLRAQPEATLQALRDIRAATAVPLMMVGPPAVDDEDQNKRLDALSDQLAEEAARLGVPYIATFGASVDSALWRREIRCGDGYHPDASGYAFLAAIIRAPLHAWLQEPRSGRASRRHTAPDE